MKGNEIMKNILYILVVFNFLYANPELVIGEERVNPGIVFIFEGAIGSMYQQIGNAVPVDLAYQIGCAIKNTVLKSK